MIGPEIPVMTFNVILILVAISSYETQGANTVTVITQPVNTTACEGGTAIFTCIVDIHNTSIVTKETQWWRTRIDQNSPSPIKIPFTASRHHTVNSIDGYRLASLLIITNVKLTHIGPYWLKLNERRNLSDVAYLSVTPNVTTSATLVNITFPEENIKDVSFVVQWNTLIQSSDRYVIVVWADGIPIQTVTVNEPSYTVTGLTPNTTYTVNVATVNSCTGPLSPNATVTTRMPFSKDANTTTNYPTFTTVLNIDPTITATTTTLNSTIKATTPTDATSDSGGSTDGDSGGSSTGAIIGGVIGGIIMIIIIVIVVIILYKLFINHNKDNEGVKKLFYKAFSSDRDPNDKNTLAASNSLMYSEVRKTETKTIPHHTTDTGELYAMSTKDVDKDAQTDHDPPLIYSYVRVEDTQRMIVGMTVSHQNAVDGAQYAVSAKATTKDDHVSNDDVNKQKENQEIKYADLQALPTPSNIHTVTTDQNSSPYVQVVT